MSMFDLADVIEQYHRAIDAFAGGDPEPVKKLFSRRDDVTLANPLGPPVRGWSQVEQATDHAASLVREGAVVSVESISENETADFAYNLEIERVRTKVGNSDEFAEVSLRVTTIFRREAGEWKIVHRHADPITAPRPIESLSETLPR
jgi:ketosteroid isomerase-like protein